MKNQLIIFSKNRANQLNLLLETLYLNSNNIFDQIVVLFKTTSVKHKETYNILINKHNNVLFVEEINFKNNLLSLIDDINYDLTTYLVDDIIFYNKIDFDKEIIFNKFTKDIICISLRLGLNCTYSHPANLHYKIYNYNELGDNMIVFNYENQMNGDFKYPLSLDGHIFRSKQIKSLIKNINFVNPNTLEANLQYYLFSYLIEDNVLCFKESKIVGSPVNLVNDTFNNRFGIEHRISEDELCDKFLNNEFIDFYKLNFSDINGPHKEIKYQFKKL
jgi:hypothetical protein